MKARKETPEAVINLEILKPVFNTGLSACSNPGVKTSRSSIPFHAFMPGTELGCDLIKGNVVCSKQYKKMKDQVRTF